MAAIDNLIDINISQATAGLSQASFAIPLIVGATATDWGTDVVRTYTAPSALLEDGFKSTDPEYLAAVAMYSQTTTPTEFCVGKRSSGEIADDLTAIFNENNTAYGVILAGLPEDDILPAAKSIEGMTKFLLTSTSDAAVPATGDGDLGSQMKDLSLSRTGLIYTAANENGVLEAAWMGSQLPQVPGSNNWAYKTLKGVSTDTLSGSQQNALYGVPISGVHGKNVNCYQTLAGANITFPGMASSGQYFDITIGVDWLTASIQTAIYSLLTSVAKIPYTTAGVTSLMNAVNQVMQNAATNGLLDANDVEYPIYVKADAVDAVPASQRANRISPTIYFGGRLQGAISSVVISGSVSI